MTPRNPPDHERRWRPTRFQKFGMVVATVVFLIVGAAFSVGGPGSSEQPTTLTTTSANPTPPGDVATEPVPALDEIAHAPAERLHEPDPTIASNAATRLATATVLFSSAPTPAEAAYQLRILMAAPGRGVPEATWMASLVRTAAEDPAVVERFRERLASGQDWQAEQGGGQFHIVPMCYSTHAAWDGDTPDGLEDITTVHVLLQWWERIPTQAWTTTQVVMEVGLGRGHAGEWRWFATEELYFLAPLPMTVAAGELGLLGTTALYDVLATCETF